MRKKLTDDIWGLHKNMNCAFPLKGSYLELMCSKRYIDEKIQFLIDTFTENGRKRKTLGKISKTYINELQNPPATNLIIRPILKILRK